MKRTVAVVDYGMGNLRSVAQALGHVARQESKSGGEWQVVVSGDPDAVAAAERIVLPGQGAMPDCMRELRDSGLEASVRDAAARKPLLGVCVGMQMLLGHSEEGASEGSGTGTPGLGLVAGEVVRFRLDGQLQPDGSRYKVPQIGWNEVIQSRPHALWEGIPDASHFYFVHSFFARPSDERHSVGKTDYGGRFTSALGTGNIFATQFHPEKSADRGLALYRNFLRWTP